MLFRSGNEEVGIVAGLAGRAGAEDAQAGGGVAGRPEDAGHDGAGDEEAAGVAAFGRLAHAAGNIEDVFDGGAFSGGLLRPEVEVEGDGGDNNSAETDEDGREAEADYWQAAGV